METFFSLKMELIKILVTDFSFFAKYLNTSRKSLQGKCNRKFQNNLWNNKHNIDSYRVRTFVYFLHILMFERSNMRKTRVHLIYSVANVPSKNVYSTTEKVKRNRLHNNFATQKRNSQFQKFWKCKSLRNQNTCD